MLEILAPAIRILLLWALTRFATLGYFTAEDASEFAKVGMDLIVYGVPLLYAWWAARQVAKAKRR